MYKVLLVDDEPIILSGIKYLIDWRECGCEVIDTAFNGQEALDKIRLLIPDIVLCDIRMPSISGTDLLELVHQEMPHVVFIMLTNYQDFDLACKALRFQASDYLIKNSLTPAALKKALEHAKLECSNRSRLENIESVNRYLELPKRDMLSKIAVNSIIKTVRQLSVTDQQLLQDFGVLSGFGMLIFQLDFPNAGSSVYGSPEDMERLMPWQMDITEKLIKNFYPDCILAEDGGSGAVIYALCWGMSEAEWFKRLDTLYPRLSAASSNVTRLAVNMLATGWFSGTGQLRDCHAQIKQLQDYRYLTGCTYAVYGGLPSVEYSPLAIAGTGSRLAAEIKSKNHNGASSVLSRAIAQVGSVGHQRSQAVWLCTELLNEICSLGREDLEKQYGGYYQEIEKFTTRSQVLDWLKKLRTEICEMLEQCDSDKSRLLEKARQYVLENLTKRITLQEAADHVNISASYLSTLFKKQYNQSFVDFVNQSKIEYACRLIREGSSRFYEISYMLGFENAYYFSKVFRKCTGMTPTEYQKSVGREADRKQ